MNGHDELCPMRHSIPLPGMTCGYCALIGQVEMRCGERLLENGQPIVEEHLREYRRNALDALWLAVSEIPHAPACPGGQGCWCPIQKVLDLIGEPSE